MSRINYSDDEEYPGQFFLWQANCDRSLQGKAGQRELRELEAALLALPSKRLIHGALENEQGEVCAIACYAKHKGVDLSKHDPEYASDRVGIEGGMPRLVAWKVVEMNDITCDEEYWATAEGPQEAAHYYLGGGISVRLHMTPEERYRRVLAWVQEELKAPPSSVRPDAGSCVSAS